MNSRPSKFVSILCIGIGASLLIVAAFMFYEYGARLSALAAQNDKNVMIKNLVHAVQWLFFVVCPGLSFLLVFSNTCFLISAIRAGTSQGK